VTRSLLKGCVSYRRGARLSEDLQELNYNFKLDPGLKNSKAIRP
jgi:hypothetical protein